MSKKAVLMLSGGLDSTVAAFAVRGLAEPVVAITFDYEQRARRQELGAAYAVAAALGIEHRTVFLPFFRQFFRGALTDPRASLPAPEPADLDDDEKAAASAEAVWVPNRNGVMIAVGAAWAESVGADQLVVGFNREEAQTFADNSNEFVRLQNEALKFSTRNGVEVVAPTGDWTKEEIVRYAVDHEVPLELCWSCYGDDDRPCGTCESCRRFDRAVDATGAREWIEQRRGGK